MTDDVDLPGRTAVGRWVGGLRNMQAGGGVCPDDGSKGFGRCRQPTKLLRKPADREILGSTSPKQAGVDGFSGNAGLLISLAVTEKVETV